MEAVITQSSGRLDDFVTEKYQDQIELFSRSGLRTYCSPPKTQQHWQGDVRWLFGQLSESWSD